MGFIETEELKQQFNDIVHDLYAKGYYFAKEKPSGKLIESSTTITDEGYVCFYNLDNPRVILELRTRIDDDAPLSFNDYTIVWDNYRGVELDGLVTYDDIIDTIVTLTTIKDHIVKAYADLSTILQFKYNLERRED